MGFNEVPGMANISLLSMGTIIATHNYQIFSFVSGLDVAYAYDNPCLLVQVLQYQLCSRQNKLPRKLRTSAIVGSGHQDVVIHFDDRLDDAGVRAALISTIGAVWNLTICTENHNLTALPISGCGEQFSLRSCAFPLWTGGFRK